MDIRKKLAMAQASLAQATLRLVDTRAAYTGGNGKAYQAALDVQADLREKIAANQYAADEAEAKFKRLFAAAGHVRTKAVNAALSEKNDAAAIAEELRIALDDSVTASQEPMLKASQEGKAYLAAHQAALQAFAVREAVGALAEQGPAIARAMRLLHELTPRGDGAALYADGWRWGQVWKNLEAMAEVVPVEGLASAPAEIGALELGPFARRSFVSPAEANAIRRMHGAEADAVDTEG